MVATTDGSDVGVFYSELLDRLPLAQSVLLLFSHVLGEQSLDQMYDEHRGRCYKRELTFAEVVYLVRDALIEHGGSGRASFVAAQEQQRLSSSVRAVYGKLSRMPLAVSMALLREPTSRLQEVLPGSPNIRPAVALPASLAGFTVIVVDGKTLKHVERRLKCLRNRRGRINSGKLLVALSLDSGLALAMNASANSEANDVSLVEGMLPQLGVAKAGEVRLYMGDRQFCDLPRLASSFVAGGHHFLVRHNANIHFHPDRARPQRDGKDDQGRRYIQQWGWLGAENHPLRRYVRKITLYRPGDPDVSVVTDLLDEQAYPAQELLEVYLARWGIERVFQQVTEVFDLKNLIGGQPRATIFQASFCLLLYNLIQVVKAYVAQAGARTVEEVSTENLFADCTAQLVTWATAGDPEAVVQAFTPAPSTGQVKRRLRQLLGNLWHDHWLKSPPQKTHRKTKTTIYPSKGYTNVWKVLQVQQSHRNGLVRQHL